MRVGLMKPLLSRDCAYAAFFRYVHFGAKIMNQARSYKNLSILGTSLFCVALLGGCAATDSVTKAQSTADQALQKADEANGNANAAKATAAQAMQKADQANATAEEAKSTANQANSTADSAKLEVEKLSEKIDMMFKKTMQK
jgi:murein lipoprotein